MKRRIMSSLLCLCLFVTVLSTVALAAGTSQFTDVNSSDYFAEPVAWAVEQGITNGTGATTFSPNQTCTRAQILTFLWRAVGSPGSGTSGTYYFDVADDAYYAKASNWATENGLLDIEGVYFKPDTPCTRAEAIGYIWAVAKRPKAAEVPFQDIAAGSTLSNAVSWAVGYGVTNGTSSTSFSPNSTCTRAQIVTFLHRYFVEPLATTPAPAPVPAPAPTDSWKLDPLPPENYREHAAWYGSLTSVGEMSNAQLVAESDSIAAVIADYKARDAFITDSIYIRKDDIMYQIMERREIVESYDEYVEYNRKYGWDIPDYILEDYENLLTKWGDPEPLRGN